MSSGFRLLGLLLRGPARRLEALRAAGDVVDVGQLGVGDEVIELGLGFGPEFWRVEPGYQIDPGAGRVRGGRLILEEGRPLADRRRLEVLARPVVRVRYRS